MRFGKWGGACEGSVFSFSFKLLCSLGSVINRKARAVYPCEAEHSSELSFEIGAIFEDGKCWQELCGGSHSVFSLYLHIECQPLFVAML